MVADKVIAPLLRVPIFMGLHAPQLSEIARQAEKIAFRSGSTITQAGVVGDGAYLIVTGVAVRQSSASTEAAEPIEPGSLIGELAMLVDHVYGATVLAQGRVTCLKILRSALLEQMEADPDLAEHFSNILTARLVHVATEMRRIDATLAAYAEPPLRGGDMPTSMAGVSLL
jgi:CRP/FNR family transcriptional regulator, cyclic AMP receptor protein